tara:strand:- start:239 stop:1060 length:822 start_codon:yes stop_codon:yes gene_type:complete
LIKYIAILIFGACVGSFINVIFYRLPKDKSIIYPNSSCPDCNSRIKFYDLIPVLSWIFLKGKCRVCNSAISYNYPLVEVLNSLLWLFIVFLNPYSTIFLNEKLAVVLNCFLITNIFIISYFDFKYLWIPKRALDFLSFIGLVYLFLKYLNGGQNISIFFIDLIAYPIFYFIFEIIRKNGQKIYKKEVLGKGDSFLVASNSLLIGIKGGFLAITIGFIVAAVCETILLILNNSKRSLRYFPLGPYLCLGMICVWIIGADNMWANWEMLIFNFIF